jgi:regulator of sigma E protease
VNLLDYLVAVIPMLGVLIFVHEFGHFLLAKACGVRVLKFSLGFGPPIGVGRFRMRWVRNGTEYVVAWFPLGGFVKMLGENLMVEGEEPAPEEVADARPEEFLNAKPTWQKLAITFAGPAMNLALPVIAFVGVLWVGVPRPAPVIGMVEEGSPAEAVGLAPGDHIVAFDGEPVAWWEDLEKRIRESQGGEITLEVARGERRFSVGLPVVERSGLDEFGSVESTGWVGLGHRRLPALLGVPGGDAPAARAGLRSGDRVTAVGGQPVADWEAFREAYAAADSGPVELTVARGEGDEEQEVALGVPALGSLERLGVVPATILVHAVSEGSPAAAAGLEAGDLILMVDGRPVGSFTSFQETVRASEGRPLHLTYARSGETHEVTLGFEEEVYLIGITHASATLPGAQELDRQRNPLVAFPRAMAMTWDMTALFLRGLHKLATGEVGADKLAGPIGIAEIARASLDLGWQAYLYTMILISINLGILNLLPIPILDGGQALLYAIEGVKRAPISLRTRELVQQVGLTVLVMLMGLAFWNDISRNWSRLVEWLMGEGL